MKRKLRELKLLQLEIESKNIEISCLKHGINYHEMQRDIITAWEKAEGKVMLIAPRLALPTPLDQGQGRKQHP